MAEALVIIGAVAAVSQLTTGMVKLTTKLRGYIKDIHKAPEEVESFLLETSNFTGLLNSFITLANRPVQNMGRKERKERDGRVYGIEKQCAYVYNKMMKLVDRFAELADRDMTAIQNIIHSIKWILRKPDVTDLRLSLQMAMIIVNCTSTLFWWEDAIAKNDESAEMFLEQLRNLRPMAKTATRRLEEHQQKHRITAEPEVNDLTNEMLIASKEIQQQIVDVIKQPAHSEATRDRSSGNSLRRKRRHDELVVQPNSHPKPRLSLAKSAGPATKGGTVIPKLRTNRASSVKSKPVDITESDDRRHLSKQPSIPPNISGSFDMFDNPPRITKPCNEYCSHKYCPYSDQTHCVHEECPCNEQDLSSEEKMDPPANGLPHRINSLSKPENSRNSSGKGGRTSHDERARQSPHPIRQSDEIISNLSNSEIESLMSEWSGTNPRSSFYERDRRPWGPRSLSRSKTGSSSLTTDGPRPPDAEKHNRDTAYPSKEGPQRTSGSNEGVINTPQKRPQPEQEQRRRPGSSQEGHQRLKSKEKRPMEERRREPSASRTQNSDGSDGSLGQELPSPYMPVPPFGGQGGRRRPRRPRPQS